MKAYIVFDKETGEVVHKYRVIPVAEGESEDTVECDAEEVLSSYRGPLPRERLEVALIADYHPQTSRGRATRYNSGTNASDFASGQPSPDFDTIPPDATPRPFGYRSLPLLSVPSLDPPE